MIDLIDLIDLIDSIDLIDLIDSIDFLYIFIFFSCLKAIRSVAISITDGGTAEEATPVTVTSGRCARAVRLVSASSTGARWFTIPSVTLAQKDSTHPVIPENIPAGPVHDVVNIARFY